jgi:hypothetical protein
MVSRLNARADGASVGVRHFVRQQAKRPSRLLLLLPLGAVLLTLLSTALCILHCHLFLLPQTAPPETTLIVFSSDAALICHPFGDEASDPLPPLDAGTLRALSEAAPTLVGLLLTVLVCKPTLSLRSIPLKPLATLAPEPPPPRY